MDDRPLTPSRRLFAALPRAAAAPVMGTGIVAVAFAGVGRDALADALLAVALAVAAALVAVQVARVARDRAGRAVATQAIAALAAAVAASLRAGWLAIAAAGVLAAGVALYAFAAASFEPAQVWRGRGDQWVAGGALAISALAAGDVDAALRATGAAAGLAGAVRTVALVLWLLAMAWLPVLVAGEVRAPRTGFDARRWSTVFPVGMYAAMSVAVGHAAARPAILAFARAWVWVAGAVWALVVAASVGRGLRLLADGPRMTAGREAQA